MKKTRWLSLLIALTLSSLNSVAQSDKWLLGNIIVDNTVIPPTSSSSSITTTTTPPNQYQQSDGVISSSLGFKIVDNKVYNASGTLQFNLPNYTYGTLGSFYQYTGENAIVPVPGTGGSFYYVIYQIANGYGTMIVYVTIEINSSGDPVLIYGPTRLDYYGTDLPWGASFAVSKSIDPLGDRYLFAVGGVYGTSPSVERFTINASGIGSLLTIQSASPSDIDDHQFMTHRVKLSPDQHFLCWIADDQTITNRSDKIWVLPLVNYDSYINIGLSTNSDAYSFSTTAGASGTNYADGGLEFSPDSRTLYYTSPSGLSYVTPQNVDPVAFNSPTIITPTVSGASDFNKSDLCMGRNGQLFAINTVTNTLSYFDIASGNTESTTSLSLISHNTAGYNTFAGCERFPKEVYLPQDYVKFTVDVEVSPICAPGFSTPPTNPQMTATVDGGTGPYTYNWYPLPGNTAVLDDYHINNPTITSSTSPYLAYFYLTVTDASHTNHVATKVVKVSLITSGWDLVSRDSHEDHFDEPNTQATVYGNINIWSSPDIWNRLAPDGLTTFQEPESGSLNYLYVRVTNIGCVTAESSDPVNHVQLYWTIGGTAETWPGNWTTDMWTTPGGTVTTLPQGREITFSAPGGDDIPSLDPGHSCTLTTSWTPPDPHSYFPPSAREMELCFLARIVDWHHVTTGNPDGMTIPEGTGLSANVRNNNNIVTLNNGVLYMHPSPPPPHPIVVGNSGSSTATFSFQFINEYSMGAADRLGALSNYAYFKVYLGDDLFDAWQNAGGNGTYAAVNLTEKSVIFDGSNTMQLDGIDIPAATEYVVQIVPFMITGADGTQMPNETVHFIQLQDDGTVYGGFSYKVIYKPEAKGVLAVTEISQGPSSDPGCEYAEMAVANCGQDASPFVDISGWIIDDNSGNFDNGGCSTNGATPGHYRLNPNSGIWQKIRVGSKIVVYNANVNCYNLPSTFTIDEDNHIYYVPLLATADVLPPDGNAVIERHS